LASKYKKIALGGGVVAILVGIYVLFSMQLLSDVQQYPIVGGVWQNDVNVTGTGYFYVVDYGSRFGIDYDWNGLYCNGELIPTYKWKSRWGNTRYAVRDYHCNGVTSWKVIVKTVGEHKQKVCFGAHRNTKRRICKIVRNYATEKPKWKSRSYRSLAEKYQKIKIDKRIEGYSTQDVMDSDYLIATDKIFYGSDLGIANIKVYVSTKRPDFDGKIGIEMDKSLVEIVQARAGGKTLFTSKQGKNNAYVFEDLIPISGEYTEVGIVLKYDPTEVGLSDKFDIVLYDSAGNELQRLDPFLSGWSYRQKVTLQTTSIDFNNDITNDHVIPVYVDSSNTDFWAGVDSTGKDVRFTKSDGTTTVNYHFELFDYTGEEMLAWFRAEDTFTTSSNVDYYMYYGNTSASDDQNKSGTYPSTYVAVWHLDDNSEEIGTVVSTPEGGSPTYSPASGMVYEKGYGMILDGVDDYLYFDAGLYLPSGLSSVGSMCFWVDSNTTDLQYPMDIASPSQTVYIDAGNYGPDNPAIQWNQGGTWGRGVNYTLDINYLHCVTWEDAGDLNAFQNGIADANSHTASSATGDYTGYWYWGSKRTPPASTVKGRMDEIQLFNYKLSGDEARLIYEAQAGNLVVLGSQEVAPDVNSVNIINPNGGQYLSYIDGNYAVDFNVTSADDNYLHADIYYSTVAGAYENPIVTDLNLFDAGLNPTVDVNCTSTDFSLSAGVRCFYDVNWNFADGNYYLDINIYTQSDINFVDSSDSSFYIDNTYPAVSVDWNNFWQQTDANVLLSVTEASNNFDLNISIDTDPTDTITYADTNTYHADSNVLITADGNYSIKIELSDVAGHILDTNTVEVLKDSLIPDVNEMIPNDGNMDYHSQTVSFDLNKVKDSDVNVLATRIDINGVQSANFDYSADCSPSDGNWVCSYTETAFDTNGTDYNITIWVDDNAGNQRQFESIFKYVIETNPPQLDINGVEGVVDTALFPRNFNYSLDYNLAVQFTAQFGSNTTSLMLDLNFNTSQTEGGTVIWDDLTLDATNCTSSDFNTQQTCTVDWNIMGISDGNYYLVGKLIDGASPPQSDLNYTDYAVPIGIIIGNVNEYYRSDVNGIQFYPTFLVDYNVTPVGQNDVNGILEVFNTDADTNLSMILLDRHILSDFETGWANWRPDQNSDALPAMSSTDSYEGSYSIVFRIDGLPDVNGIIDNNYARWTNDSFDWNITDSTEVETGAPLNGVITIHIKTDQPEKINDINVIIGNDLGRCVYLDVNHGTNIDANTWYVWDINLAQGTVIGTPIWGDVNFFVIDFNLADRLTVNEFDFNVLIDFIYIRPTQQALFNQDKGTSLCVDIDNNRSECKDLNQFSPLWLTTSFDGNTSQGIWMWLDINLERFRWDVDYFYFDYNIWVGDEARA